MSSNNHIVLITGANTGIGLEVCLALAASPQPYNIIMAGRSLEKVRSAIETVKKHSPDSKSILDSVAIDVESDDSIQKAFEHVSSKYGKIDTLVNNAGAQFDLSYHEGKLSMREAWNKGWDVNVTGSQIMTHIFMPILLKSDTPRLLFLASGTASLQESESLSGQINAPAEQGWPKTDTPVSSYRSAKTGLNMMMREWSRRLFNDGVKVFGISPGFLATGLSGDPKKLNLSGAKDPSIGGKFIKDVIEGGYDNQSGKTIRSHEIQPW